LEITAAMVKQVRQVTGAGVLDCRRALEASAGDFENAIARLRKKGSPRLPSERAARPPMGAWKRTSITAAGLLYCWN